MDGDAPQLAEIGALMQEIRTYGRLPHWNSTAPVRNARKYVNDWSVVAPFLFCAPDGGVAMVRRLRVGPVCCGARGRNFLEVMEIH